MSEKTVDAEKVEKALSALKALASEDKVEKSANTISTQTVGMTGVGGSTQVFHTPSNSDPGTWAGSSFKEVPANGASDGISENGTDYGTKAMVKSVLDLLASQKITADVAALLLEKALPFEKKDDDKGDEDKDDDKKDVKKSQEAGESVEKSLASGKAVQDAFEVSEFLKDFVDGFAKALTGLENRLGQRLEAIETATASHGSFQKSITDVVSTLGQVAVENTKRVEELAVKPARAPKSVQVINKSFAGRDEDAALSPLQIKKGLESLSLKGEISPYEVVLYESSGDISEDTLRRVTAAVAGK